jgi:ParB family chromosome partitioning protein
MGKGIRDLFSKKGEEALQTILGSGEGAVPEEEDLSAGVSQEVAQIPVDDIAPNPFQSRKRFDEEKIWTLSESLKGRGMLHPIALRKAAGQSPGYKYEVIAGERRLRAAKLAGLTEVPAMIREVDDREMKLLTLIENMQREELNVVEKTLSIGSLQREIGDTAATAEALGLSRRSVERYARIESVMTSSKMLLSLFQRNADLIDFRDAEALAEIGRRLGQEELRDFVEAVNDEGIKRALKSFRRPPGNRPGLNAQHPPVHIALRETERHISLQMRHEKGSRIQAGDRERLQREFAGFLERIEQSEREAAG